MSTDDPEREFYADCHGCGRPTADCPPNLTEPPDGTRIEFESGTDVYAVWRCDESSEIAGYQIGDGGEVWCLYGHSVPTSWAELLRDFGTCSLALGVRLVPDPADVPNYLRWPTKVYEATGKWPNRRSESFPPSTSDTSRIGEREENQPRP